MAKLTILLDLNRSRINNKLARAEKNNVDFFEERCQWILENKDEILRQHKESGIEVNIDLNKKE